MPQARLKHMVMNNSNSIYQQIEQAIIAWSIDGETTAGTLTREIMDMIQIKSVCYINENTITQELADAGNAYLNKHTKFELAMFRETIIAGGFIQGAQWVENKLLKT